MVATAASTKEMRRFRVRDLEVDVARAQVTRNGVPLELPRLSFDLLLALIDCAPAIATNEYLLERVWPRTVVNPETVAQRLKLLRAALGDDPKQPRYFAVVRGRGYRLIPAVEISHLSESEQPVDAPTVGTPSAAEGTLPRARERSRVPRALIATAVAAIVIGVVLWQTLKTNTRSPSISSSSEQASPLPARTIAVLAFETLGDPNDQYLSSGIAESILHNLAGLPQINVIGRNSSFAFKGRAVDDREIGRTLGARYLLEGTLQRLGDDVRITAQLVDAQVARTLWSVAFERRLAEIFGVQDEIARKVARALLVTLDASNDERLVAHDTHDVDAYLEYLKGRELSATSRWPDMQNAMKHYQRAIELDPKYSSAYSGLAWALFQENDDHVSNSDAREWQSRRKEIQALVDKALALNERNADAWQVRAAIEEDMDRSETYDRRAVALEPNLARAQFGLSRAVFWHYLSTQPWRFPEVLQLVKLATQLDPLEPRYATDLATVYYLQRSSAHTDAESERLLQRTLNQSPNYLPALISLSQLYYCCMHRYADGARLAEQALVVDPSSTTVRGFLAHLYLSMGDEPAAQDVLKDAGNQGASAGLYKYRRQWSKAAAIILNDDLRYTIPTPPDAGAAMFGLYMHSLVGADAARSLAILEEESRIGWSDDGTPVLPVPTGDDMATTVFSAHLLIRGGNPEKGRRLLEQALKRMDEASIRYGRGERWFSLNRTRALALLGRTEQALTVLPQIAECGEAARWPELRVDPAFDSLRSQPRFNEFIAEQERFMARQRKLLEEMRSRQLVPRRPG